MKDWIRDLYDISLIFSFSFERFQPCVHIEWPLFRGLLCPQLWFSITALCLGTMRSPSISVRYVPKSKRKVISILCSRASRRKVRPGINKCPIFGQLGRESLPGHFLDAVPDPVQDDARLPVLCSLSAAEHLLSEEIFRHVNDSSRE